MDRLEALEVARESVAHQYEVMSDRLVGSPAWNELRETLFVLDEMIRDIRAAEPIL